MHCAVPLSYLVQYFLTSLVDNVYPSSIFITRKKSKDIFRSIVLELEYCRELLHLTLDAIYNDFFKGANNSLSRGIFHSHKTIIFMASSKEQQPPYRRNAASHVGAAVLAQVGRSGRLDAALR